MPTLPSDAANTVKLRNPFVPVSYGLHVSVDLAGWKYDGKETIVLRRAADVEGSKELQLHYNSTMAIHEVCGATIVGHNQEASTLQLQLSGETAEEYTVTFSYTQEIREEMRGFYRVCFKTGDGTEHRMAATHFEPTAARCFYICQDEPAARADFKLRVSLPCDMENYTVLSNGPLRAKKVESNVVTYDFEMVPAVPPYLTACFVGELEHIGTTTCGIPIRVYTVPGKLQRAAFALRTTAFALEYFEKFFDCKYPLPKLDVVAVPDFPIGGMENWGCIACVEAILVDEETSSVAALKGAAELICHEVSHNWFGNLVTVNWWEGLWLKEGFASWCGYDAAHQLQPAWRANEDANASVASALISDMYEHSHPVEVPIRDPAEITQIFDAISYDKGMGLVHMLEAFLGEKWASSVAHYIKKHRYGATTTKQLWEALEESSGVPLTEAMDSFTTQMGFPLVHVSRPSSGVVILRQEPCQFASATERRSTLWCVPVVLEGANGTSHRVALRGSGEQRVDLPKELAQSPWINANPRRRGFFRCRYDEASFSSLLGAYKSLTIPDRCGLIADTLASVYMGNNDVERLSILRCVLTERELNAGVWQEYYHDMNDFLGFVEDGNVRRELRHNLMYQIMVVATKLVSTEPCTAEERLQRAFFINACISTALHCLSAKEALALPAVEWALKEADAYLGGSTYTADTLTMSLAAYIRLGPGETSARAQTVWNRFAEAHDNVELCRWLLRAVCYAEDAEFVEGIAKRCIYNDGIRSQYGGVIFSAMAGSPSLPNGYVWSLFKKHFQGIEKQWGSGTFRIQAIVEAVGSSLTGEAYAKEFDEFFRLNPLPHARLAVHRAVERIRMSGWLQSRWGCGQKLSYLITPR
uniref:Aminopeptidase n=1 Tax=Trypanosoma brucei brucei TaxID=5702 RepID=Q6Q832_TRYBB|nr:cytosol alanyl aminopeptidase [Trypanosoma brucei brucei]